MNMTRKILCLFLTLIILSTTWMVPVPARAFEDPILMPQILSPNNQSFAILPNGDLFEWGRRYDDSDSTPTGFMEYPTLILSNVKKVVSYSLSNFTPNYAIKSDGSLWGWGMNATYGQLATGNYENSDIPVLIMNNVKDVIVGDSTTLAIKDDNSLWGWGYGAYNKLGTMLWNDVQGNVLEPIKILDNVKQAISTHKYTLAIKLDGSVWGCGTSYYSGMGSNISGYDVPTLIMENVVKIVSSPNELFESTYAIKTDGSLWAWGYNSHYQIGNGTNIQVNNPEMILDNVKDVISGEYATFAIKNDDSLWGWGMNGFGELGDGTSIAKSRPVYITDQVKKISSTYFQTMVLKFDGSLWVSGYNGGGNFGDGTTNHSVIPIKVLEGVYNVESANDHTLVVMKSGEIMSWGLNPCGQLGDGTIEQRLSPTLISALTPVSVDWVLNDIFIGQYIDFSGSVKSFGTMLSSVEVFIDSTSDLNEPLKWYESLNINKSSFDLSNIPSIKSGSIVFGDNEKGLSLNEGDYEIVLVAKYEDGSRTRTFIRNVSIYSQVIGNNVGTFSVDKNSGSLKSVFHFSVIPNSTTSQVLFQIEKSGTSKSIDSGYGVRQNQNLITFDYRFAEIGSYTITAYPINQNGRIVGDGINKDIIVSETYYIDSIVGTSSIDLHDNAKFSIYTSEDTIGVVYQLTLRGNIIKSEVATKDGTNTFSIDIKFEEPGEYKILVFPCDQSGPIYDSMISKSFELTVNGDNIFNQFPSDLAKYNYELAKLSAEYSILAYEDMVYAEGIYYKRGLGDDLPSSLISRLIYEQNFDREPGRFLVENYGNDTDPHNIAYSIATRTVTTDTGEIKPLVLVTLRGTYGNEWQGNMDVTGDIFVENSTFHYSFNHAATLVNDSLIDFLNINNINDALILVTGHSRGAAVGNILSSSLTDQISTNPRIGSVVSYLFATPNAVTDQNEKPSYSNIYNFSLSDDFVPQVPLNTQGWGFGKYGKNFVNSAYWLHNSKAFIDDYYKSFIFSDDRHPKFDGWATETVLYHWEKVWNSLESYYEKNTGYFGLGIPMYNYMHDIIAVLANDRLPETEKFLVYEILAGYTISSYVLPPVTVFFANGLKTNTINDTHSPLTYYYALLSGGFEVTPEITGIEYSINQIKGLSLTQSSLPLISSSINEYEKNRLYDFASIGTNALKLGWNLDDPSTWQGIEWTDTAESRVKAISLPYLELTGTLSLTDFNEIESIDVRGNQLDSINIVNCLKLNYLNVDFNNLQNLDVGSCTKITQLHASYNHLSSLNVSVLDSLTVLDLTQNQLLELEFGSISLIEQLYLSGNSLRNIDLTLMKQLNSIDLNQNNLNVSMGTLLYIQLNEVEQRNGGWASYDCQKITDYAKFNEEEISTLRAFAAVANNNELLNWNQKRPQEWTGISWEEINDIYRVVRIDLSNTPVEGIFDSSLTPFLTYLNLNHSMVSGIDISSLTSLNYLNAAYSKLHFVKLNENHGLNTLIINDNYLNTSETDKLQSYIQSYPSMITHYENQIAIVQPSVKGVEDGGIYNHDITVEYDFGDAILNDEVIESGKVISQEGNYELKILYDFGLHYQLSFIIDKTAPVLSIDSYITDPTNQDITATASTNEGTLNAESHTFTENGSFEFIATDTAGNVSTYTVTITNIDKVAPIITIGNYLNTPINKDVIVTASTNEGTMNSTSHTFTENGSYEFIATDEAGNVTKQTVTITNIDKVSPVITGVLDGKIYNGLLTPTFDEGAGLLDGSLFLSGKSVSSYGEHTLIVTDVAGNTTTVNFTIVPISTSISVISHSYTSLHVSWNEVEGVAGYEVYRGFNATGSFAKVAMTDALDFIHNGLATNRSFFYKVRSYVVVEGITYYSDFSPVVSGKPIPAAPTSIDVVAVNSSSMNITWAAVEGATGYQLFRSFGPTGTFTLAASTTTNSYLNTGLTLNRTYFYRVRAYTMVGTTRVVGPYSPIDSAKPIPAAPTNILAGSGGYDRINLSWTPAIGAGGYTIYRATSLTGSYSIVGNVTTSNFINTGLAFNTTYYYKVRSYYLVNGVKSYGMMSEPINAKTVISTPTVTSSNLSTTSIKLTWGAIFGASGYEVYRSTTSNGTYALQGTVTTNTYSKTGLVKGTVYYYKVRAYRLVGTTKVYGEYSSPKYVKVGY